MQESQSEPTAPKSAAQAERSLLALGLLALGAGAALAFGLYFWTSRARSPLARANRMIRECQHRISTIETTFSQLETALGEAKA